MTKNTDDTKLRAFEVWALNQGYNLEELPIDEFGNTAAMVWQAASAALREREAKLQAMNEKLVEATSCGLGTLQTLLEEHRETHRKTGVIEIMQAAISENRKLMGD